MNEMIRKQQGEVKKTSLLLLIIQFKQWILLFDVHCSFFSLCQSKDCLLWIVHERQASDVASCDCKEEVYEPVESIAVEEGGESFVFPVTQQEEEREDEPTTGEYW